MKKQFSYAVLALVPLACKNPTPQLSLQQPVEKQAINILNPFQQSEFLNKTLNNFHTAAQKFVIANGSRHQLVGKKGTIIELEAADLETTDGSPTGKQIDVALIELQNQDDFLRNEMSTTSDGKLLVSGGAYFINCSSAGKILQVKKGKTIAVSIPKLTDAKMNLFYGLKTGKGNINWKPAKKTFEDNVVRDSVWADVPKLIARDTMYGSNWRTRYTPADDGGATTPDSTPALNNELSYVLDTEYHREKMPAQSRIAGDGYDHVNISHLGWINCDRFYNAEKTSLSLELPATEQRIFVRTFIIYKSMNSVSEHEFTSSQESNHVVIPDLPANQAVRITSFAYYEGKMHTFSKEIKLKPHAHLELDMKPADQAEINRLFEGGARG